VPKPVIVPIVLARSVRRAIEIISILFHFILFFKGKISEPVSIPYRFRFIGIDDYSWFHS